MTSRKEQKEQRKKQILMCALKLFSTKGFAATKVSDIAAAADMSAGLMFHYFASKEDVLEELVKIGLYGTQQAMQVEADEPLAFFRQAATMIFSYIQENEEIKYMFVLMERLQHEDSIPASIRSTALQVDNVEKSIPLIEEGQRKGQIRAGDPFALSIAFWSSIQGFAVMLAFNENLPFPEPEWFVDILKNKEYKQESEA